MKSLSRFLLFFQPKRRAVRVRLRGTPAPAASEGRTTLVLTLRPGEGVEVGGPVRVVYSRHDAEKILLVFKARPEVSILRDGAVKRTA